MLKKPIKDSKTFEKSANSLIIALSSKSLAELAK